MSKRTYMIDGGIRTKKEIIKLYDYLIDCGSKNIGVPIDIGYRNWNPTEKSIETLKSRRNKLKKGV